MLPGTCEPCSDGTNICGGTRCRHVFSDWQHRIRSPPAVPRKPTNALSCGKPRVIIQLNLTPRTQGRRPRRILEIPSVPHHISVPRGSSRCVQHSPAPPGITGCQHYDGRHSHRDLVLTGTHSRWCYVRHLLLRRRPGHTARNGSRHHPQRRTETKSGLHVHFYRCPYRNGSHGFV